MTRSKLARRIYEVSTIHGQFRLRSGATSNIYFDKYRFESDPMLLHDIALAMRQLIPNGVDALAGLEMGGIPLATTLSWVTGLPALFVRKVAKEYGTCNLVEGREVSGLRLAIVEDVVTSGGQIIESCRELRKLGAEIIGVICVIDRESGGPENLAKEDLKLTPLFTMSELKAVAGHNS